MDKCDGQCMQLLIHRQMQWSMHATFDSWTNAMVNACNFLFMDKRNVQCMQLLIQGQTLCSMHATFD